MTINYLSFLVRVPPAPQFMLKGYCIQQIITFSYYILYIFNLYTNFDKKFERVLVTKIVEQAIVDKVDTQYVAAQFPHWPNVGITFLCTQDENDQEEDEWIDDKGRHNFSIRLPYDLVQRSNDVRAFMVAIVKERLGEVA